MISRRTCSIPKDVFPSLLYCDSRCSQTCRRRSEACRRRSQTCHRRSEACRRRSQACRRRSQACRRHSEACRRRSQTCRRRSQTCRRRSQTYCRRFQTCCRRFQTCRRRSQVLPGVPKVLSGAPRCSQTYHNHSHGTPVPVIRDLSYSEGQPDCPPTVWYSPEIDASKFTLHILSDTSGDSQRLKYILLMMWYMQRAVSRISQGAKCWEECQIAISFSKWSC